MVHYNIAVHMNSLTRFDPYSLLQWICIHSDKGRVKMCPITRFFFKKEKRSRFSDPKAFMYPHTSNRWAQLQRACKEPRSWALRGRRGARHLC